MNTFSVHKYIYFQYIRLCLAKILPVLEQYLVTKIIKGRNFLTASGTVAERDAIAYTSAEFTTYVDNLRDATVDLEILEAKRESWQREVEIWRTLSANKRR